jgi:hypothetical protein
MLDNSQPFLASPPENTPPIASSLSAPDALPAAHSVLLLEPDNVRNAVFRAPNSTKPLYVIHSDDRGDGTEITLPGSGGEAATIHRKALTPSVTLAGTRLMIKRWLRPTRTGVTFQARGNAYEWRPNQLGQLTLYDLRQPDVPIAYFVRSRKRVIEGTEIQTRAYLALERAAEPIRNDVVVSLLIVEESARMQAQRRAAY